MSTTFISATQLKNDTAAIINTVIFNKRSITIEKYGKPVARIVPIVTAIKKLTLEEALAKTYGSVPDFPEVHLKRTFRKRTISL